MVRWFHLEDWAALSSTETRPPFYTAFSPHFLKTLLLTIVTAEATEMATAAAVAATVVVVTAAVVTEEVLAATVWALSALASRTRNGVCPIIISFLFRIC